MIPNELEDDEEFVAALNSALTDPNPGNRIRIAHHLARGLGRLLVMPAAGLEQLVNKLQAEHDKIQREGAAPWPDEIVQVSLENARFILATFRAFLKHKPAIVAELNAQFPNRTLPE